MQIGPPESECSVFSKCQSCDAVERVAKATMMQLATLPSELGDVTCTLANAAEESLGYAVGASLLPFARVGACRKSAVVMRKPP